MVRGNWNLSNRKYQLWVTFSDGNMEGCLKEGDEVVSFHAQSGIGFKDNQTFVDTLMSGIDPKEVTLISNLSTIRLILRYHIEGEFGETVSGTEIHRFLSEAGVILPKHRRNMLHSTLDLEDFLKDHMRELQLAPRHWPDAKTDDEPPATGKHRYSVWLDIRLVDVGALETTGALVDRDQLVREVDRKGLSSPADVLYELTEGIPEEDEPLIGVWDSTGAMLLSSSGGVGVSKHMKMVETLYHFLSETGNLLPSWVEPPLTAEQMWHFWRDHIQVMRDF